MKAEYKLLSQFETIIVTSGISGYLGPHEGLSTSATVLLKLLVTMEASFVILSAKPTNQPFQMFGSLDLFVNYSNENILGIKHRGKVVNIMIIAYDKFILLDLIANFSGERIVFMVFIHF